MTKKYKIYLAGGMTGLSYEEANNWREEFDELLNGLYKTTECVNPVKYYSIEAVENIKELELEAMKFDLHHVKTSDLIIVNFNSPGSLGTMAELAIAYDRSIPIIGLNENDNELHPWCKFFCHKILGNMDELVDYVAQYYLV